MPNLLSKLYPLCFLQLLYSVEIAAQEAPSLEQLLKTPLTQVPKQIEVSTAARYAQASSQSAGVTYVVTANDIEYFQWQTLAQILQSLPGIYISSDSVFQYMGVRGLGQPGDFNSRLLFLIDGVRINENIYDAALLGSDAIIDVENIERIEFAAGPGAAVYGNNAFFGVVNILTKSARQLHGAAVKMTLQSDGANKYYVNSAHRLSQGSEWWMSASHQQHPEIHNPLPVPTGFEQEFARLNAEHLTRLLFGAKHQGFRLQALWSEQDRTQPNLVPTPQGEQAIPIRDKSENVLVSLTHQHDLSENFSLNGHLNYNSSLFRRDIPFYSPRVGLTDFRSNQPGRWYSGDLILHYRGFSEHDMLVGVEMQDDIEQQIENWLVAEPEQIEGFYGKNQRKSLFIQDQWQLNSVHSLLLGARYDESKISGHKHSPRLGWVWQRTESEQVKMVYGSSYRAANLYEFSTNQYLGAELPANEEISSLELSYEKLLSASFSYRLALFDSSIQKLISIAPGDAVFTNAQRLHNYGAQFDVDWRLSSGQKLNASWSWQRGHDPSGEPLQNSPNHLLKMQYLHPVQWLQAQFSLQALAVSQREVDTAVMAGYMLWHAGFIWQPDTDHQLVAQVHNILDKDFYDRPVLGMPPLLQPGRMLRVSWRWQLW